MAGAALQHDALLPRAPGGNAAGAALALLVHAGLVVALTLGIDWRNREPEAVSAELWAAVPQTAAPPPEPVLAPPPPPPLAAAAEVKPDADIAVEQERRRKAEADRKKTAQDDAERQRLADKKVDKKAADKAADDDRKQREAEKLARDKADDDRLAKQREENLRRLMGQAGGTPGQTAPSGTATQSAAPSANYAGKVKAAVRPNIVYTGSTGGNAAAEVEVSAAPGGTILARRLVKSSGNKEWDDAVMRAIDKTQAMPRDTDGRVQGSLLITFRPGE